MKYTIVAVLLLFRTLVFKVYCFNIEVRSPIVKRGESGSYFGYSVAQHKSVENSNSIEYSWILVGAPLGKNLQPGTNHSGALYKCPINLKALNTRDCIQIETDGRRKDSFDYDEEEPNEQKHSLSPPGKDEIKDGQWLGVNIKSQGPGGKVIACAHRYITSNNLNSVQYGLGLCYSLRKDLEWDEQHEPCKGRPVQHEHQQFGYCQAGTGLAMLQDGTALIGAPGPYTWRGTMFVSNIAGEFLQRDKTVYYGPLNDKPEPIEKYSYLGMSVSAGKYFDDQKTYYSSGAPRSNSTGQVYIFQKIHHTVVMDIKLILNGEQFASNFGYEIMTTDINNDGHDDLIVAAPFYYENDKGGAVYVYTTLRNCTVTSCEADQKITAAPLEARFGFSMTALGDINKDGYNDVAVGAPYEGGGAIYIYLGAQNGLNTVHSQKIHLEVDGIQTVGYSLSGGIDMDNNGYPDLLTGAYDSDMVILFRTRPIVDIVIEVNSWDKHKIDISKKGCKADRYSQFTCFSFESCFILKSAKGLNNVEIKSRIDAETFQENRKYSRVWFKKHKNLNETRHSYIDSYVKISEGKTKYCQTETAYIKNNTRDILNPIKFRVQYSLSKDEENSPILNRTSKYVFSATFQKDCGGDDICESHLILDARLILPEESPNTYRLDLGTVKEIMLNVSVENKGESAYEAQVFVFHSPTISYIGLNEKLSNIKCTAANKTIVSCSIGNPFKTDNAAQISLRFESKTHEEITENELEFNVFVNSTSNELSNQTSSKLTALIRTRAEVRIVSASTQYIIYGGEIKGEAAMKYFDDIGLRVWHRYQVINDGPWKIQDMNVVIYWPHQVASDREEGKWLLYLDEVPYIEVTDQKNHLCVVEGGFNVNNFTSRFDNETPPDNLVELPDFYQSYHNYSSSSFSSSSSSFSTLSTRRKREEALPYIINPELETGSDGKTRKFVKMDCESRTAKCIKITCKLTKMEKGSEATIQINSRLWNSTLLEDYSNVDFVTIKSKGVIVIPDRNIIQSADDDIAYAVTKAYPDLLSTQDTGVSIWIYVGAALLGILVLIFLILILWKLGFFKRKRVSDPTLSGNLTKQSEAENLL